MANERDQEKNIPETLTVFTRDLIGDLKKLRTGKITISQARALTAMAREILRSVHLQIEGAKYFSGRATPLPASKPASKGDVQTS